MKIALFAAAMASVSTAALAQTYQRTNTGIVVTPAQGPEAAVRLQIYGDDIIRVSSTPSKDLSLPPSLMVTAKPQITGFTVTEGPGTVTLKTAKAAADVNLATGKVSFRDPA